MNDRHPKRELAILGAILLASSTGVRAGRTFREGLMFGFGDSASTIVVEDFDGDGRFDLATTQPAVATVRVYRSTGGAEPFASAQTYAVGLAPVSLVSRDVDGDGAPDLLCANSGSSTVTVLIQRDDGTFDVQQEIVVGAGVRALDLLDFDEDGTLDMVTSNLISDDLSIVRGRGDGHFEFAGRLPVGDNPHDLVAGDFDGDGHGDVVVIHSGGGFSGVVSLFLGRGDGSFAAALRTVFDPVGDAVPRMVEAGDFDSDGMLDVAVLTDAAEIFLLFQRESGSFVPTALPAVDGHVPGGVRDAFLLSRDVDADGATDLVSPVIESSSFGVRIDRGRGDGSFHEPEILSPGGGVRAADFGDFDGDGVVDFVVAWTENAELAAYPGLGSGRFAVRGIVPLRTGPRALLEIGSRDGERAGLVTFSGSSISFVEWSGRDRGEVRFKEEAETRFPGRAFRDLAAGQFSRSNAPGKAATFAVALTDIVEQAVTVFRFEAGGAFVPIARRSVGGVPDRLVSADFDRDGVDDLAVTNRASSRVHILFEPAEPVASKRDLSVEAGSVLTEITAGDLDGDGFPELVLGSELGVSILRNEEGIRFEVLRTFGERVPSGAMRVVDFDHRGTPDLAIATHRRVEILGDAATAEEMGWRPIEFPDPIRVFEVSDVNGDGESDVVAASLTRVFVAKSADRLEFSEPERYAIGLAPSGLVLGDFSGDGAVDCVSADSATRSLSVLRGTRVPSESFRRGDVDGDGRRLLTDAVVILGHLFRGGAPLLCPDAADTDDDGSVEINDVIRLLSHLFSAEGPPLANPGFASCGADETVDLLAPCRVLCP